ncbi:MAG: ArsR family transcriptional regulator [Deltaproteobacteria bacterium]|jgi:hypothetical protein|nr:ArsR family transcriptional regulator [Deltaproteobacteria bacterium]
MNERLSKLITEDRRLVILRLLSSVPDYSLNSIVLGVAVQEQAHVGSFDVIRSDAAWLAEQGLVTIKNPSPDLMVLTLTPRGKDVARGSSRVPGVKVPEPGLDDDL